MNEAQPEQGWFEKADQDLEMARRAMGPEKPLPAMAWVVALVALK